VRVIARLTQERDEARDALSKVTVGATRAGAGGEAMQVDSAALPQAVVELIENTQARYVTSDVSLVNSQGTITQIYPILEASRRPAASVPFPKVGPPPNLSPHTSPLRAPSLCTLEAALSQSTQPVNLHLSVVSMVLWACTPFPKRLSCKL
jgi:hypothetical protein